MKKINHIGIAVEKIDDCIAFYRDTLGLAVGGTETVEEQKVKVLFLTIGDTRIELLEPTSPESPIAKFIEKKGTGIHHIAFEVEDIVAELTRMKERGVKLIDENPRCGAHHTKIAFVHPKESKGVLVELTQSDTH